MRNTLREIASYNPDELREWGEDNAADMVELARTALGRGQGDPLDTLTPLTNAD